MVKQEFAIWCSACDVGTRRLANHNRVSFRRQPTSCYVSLLCAKNKLKKENKAMKEKIVEKWCEAIQKLNRKKCHCPLCPVKEFCDLNGHKNEVGGQYYPPLLSQVAEQTQNLVNTSGFSATKCYLTSVAVAKKRRKQGY